MFFLEIFFFYVKTGSLRFLEDNVFLFTSKEKKIIIFRPFGFSRNVFEC